MSLILAVALSQEPRDTSIQTERDTLVPGCLWRACLVPSLGITGAAAFGALAADVFHGGNAWQIGAFLGGGLGVLLGYDMGKKLDKLSARSVPPEHREKSGPLRNTFQRVSLVSGYGLFSHQYSFQHRNFPSMSISYCIGYATGPRFGLFGYMNWVEMKQLDPETGVCAFYSWEEDRMLGAMVGLGARQTKFDFALSCGLGWFDFRYTKYDPILGEEWPESGNTLALVALLDAGLMLSPRTGLALGVMGYLPYLWAYDSYGPQGGNLLEIRGGLFYEW